MAITLGGSWADFGNILASVGALGTAAFGPALSSPGVSASIVAAQDGLHWLECREYDNDSLWNDLRQPYAAG